MTNPLIAALEPALARYGTYTYGDKGAREVMDVDTLAAGLCALPAETVLVQMAELGEHPHGAELYDELFSALVEDDLHPDAETLYQQLPVHPGGLPIPQRTATPRPIVLDTIEVSELLTAPAVASAPPATSGDVLGHLVVFEVAPGVWDVHTAADGRQLLASRETADRVQDELVENGWFDVRVLDVPTPR